MTKMIFRLLGIILLVLLPGVYGFAEKIENDLPLFSSNIHEKAGTHSHEIPLHSNYSLVEICFEEANFNITGKFKGYSKSNLHLDHFLNQCKFSIQKVSTFWQLKCTLYILFRNLRL